MQRAFTLIELLIVIGIIAILAIIALPNFLEAQIRAKVSRAKSDLRTIVTGIELYRVDQNRYPTYHYVDNSKAAAGFSFHLGGTVTSFGQSPPFNGMNPVTTPIAYLSSMPRDIFGTPGPEAPREAGEFYFVNWDYAIQVLGTSGGVLSVLDDLREKQGSWRLHSQGPDLFGPDTDNSTEVYYDPTNGSVSRGDILRTQKGAPS